MRASTGFGHLRMSSIPQGNSIIDEAEVLRKFPEAGILEGFLTHRPEQFRSLLANKHYKLIYTVERDDVVIHAVWDCRRNPDELITETH